MYIADIVEGLSHIAAVEGEPEYAARLFGGAQARRESADISRWVYYREEYERSLALARAQLSKAQWQAAWAEGYALSLEQIVMLALAG